MPKYVAVTGHRPDKLGGYTPTAFQRLQLLAEQELAKLDPLLVYTGMALGWDQACAAACKKLGLDYVACVPFAGQESVWPAPARTLYQELLDGAWDTVVVSQGGYSAYKMQIRNQYMVDKSIEEGKQYGALLALWNGTSGGTANCVRYAERKGVEVVNCWEEYTKLLSQT